MTQLRRVTIGLGLTILAIVAATACSEPPTAVRADAPVDSAPTFDVVIGPGDGGEAECDPWLDPNWCEEDDEVCMESAGPGAGGGASERIPAHARGRPGRISAASTCDPGGDTGDTGSGGGSDGGGDGSTGSSTLYDDETFDCHSTDDCDLRPALRSEVQAVQAAIDQIRDDHPTCSAIRDRATAMLSNGLFMWDDRIVGSDGRLVLGDVEWYQDPTTGETIDARFHFWVDGVFPWTVVHEALHGLEVTHDGTYGGQTMSYWQDYCT